MQQMGLWDFLDGVPDDYEPKTRMSAEETEKAFDYLKNHPLFLDQIPENLDQYPEMQALQNLAYDDTPYNIAKILLEKANDIVRNQGSKNYFLKKALEVYSDGINQECGDKDIIAKLFSNRALVQYKLKNYKAAIQDCKWAIETDPNFIKPYYRCAQCLYQLTYYSEANKMCDLALQIAKEKDIIELKAKIEEQLKKLQEQKEEEKKQQELVKICRTKGIRVGPASISLPSHCQPKKFFLQDGQLVVPILITYPEFQQRDFIQHSYENDLFTDHLNILFQEPLPWDTEQNYTIELVEAYIELDDGLHAKINKNAHMLTIMKGYSITIRDFIEIIIVSPQSNYYKRFRQEYKIVNT